MSQTSSPSGPSGDGAAKRPPSRLELILEKHSAFLSSFVLGLAGLVATSLWQWRQSKNAEVEAATQRDLAVTKAENDWRIARAEILAKNLDVLSSTAPGAADRKYGVLLSLTRGNILDPELAVSYALELGRENAYYMRSVLASAANKNYTQLAQAYALTCLQRFGAERAVPLCKDDRLAERSEAIAELVQDELQAQDAAGTAADPRKGPMQLLLHEDEVQAMPAKLAWMFEPYLQGLYEQRRWKDIARFEAWSTGARLVAAMVLATARTGELVAAQESARLEEFHEQRRRWLMDYLLGRGCDPDCRASIVEYMLSTMRESDGDYEELLTRLLLRPRAEVGRAVNQLHARVLWCQIDGDDQTLLRDRALLPAAERALGLAGDGRPAASNEPGVREDVVALLALLQPPTDAQLRSRWDKVHEAIQASAELQKLHAARLARAERQRNNPPAMVRHSNFCGAPLVEDAQGL